MPCLTLAIFEVHSVHDGVSLFVWLDFEQIGRLHSLDDFRAMHFHDGIHLLEDFGRFKRL